jgi:hypothetical protein
MANLASQICDLVILNYQRTHLYSPLHCVVLTGLGNKFFYLLDLLEFCCMIQAVFLVLIIIRFSSVFTPYS